jgi:palmitoyl transferase
MKKKLLKAVMISMLCAPLAARADDSKECDFKRDWMSSACQRVMRVVHDGTWDLYVTGYGWHIDGFSDRSELNPWSYGGGAGKHWIDANGNEDILFAFAFSDSHHNFEPIGGYARQWYTKPVLGGLQAGGGFFVGARRAATSLITCRCRSRCRSARYATGARPSWRRSSRTSPA